jgi:succinate dehydrogenase / fumarate reductase cytochrome b subunit
MSSPQPSKRPLSPHLQVYKPQLTSVLSILHRATGAALAIGTLMIVWWLMAAATNVHAYNIAADLARSPLGLFMIFGWSFCMFYHLCNGIRHLFWDAGYLFELENAYKSGYAVVIASVVLTLAAWVCAYSF